MERHVLVVLAHPDDESFGCGGTVALHARAGSPVTVVIATRGEMGRHMGRPPFANRETLRDLRDQELKAACQALGAGDLRQLRVWDKTVEFADADSLARRVGAMIDEVKPSLLITHHPVHGVHPDHCAIGAAAVRAVLALPQERRPKVVTPLRPQMAEKEGLQVESVDVTSVAREKLHAFRAHKSQSGGIKEIWGGEAEGVAWMKKERGRETLYTYPV